MDLESELPLKAFYNPQLTIPNPQYFDPILPDPPQPRIHCFHIKRFRIEITTQPLQHLFMFGMVWIFDRV